MHFTDDLKSNFRSWELDHDNIEDAERLASILISRHPDQDPKVLTEHAYDWVGADEEE